MPLFKVIPLDLSVPLAEIEAPDPGRVLSIVERLDCKQADILRDDEYAFSVHLGTNGLWSIYQRSEDLPDIKPLTG